MTAKQSNEVVNSHSGPLGISESSSDLRDLPDWETQDLRPVEAVALFCCQTKKWVGAFPAALGGLDTLAFAGGIGENAANESVISSDASRISLRVVRADDELMIARAVCRTRDLMIGRG
jgi:acetate kinase